MHYLVDGYNLVFRIYGSPRSLEQTREKFFSDFESLFSHCKGKVSVVFDSSDEHALHYPYISEKTSFSLIFAPFGQTADEYIVERVTHHKHPKTLTVVTTDRELQRICKQHLVITQDIEDFVTFLYKKSAQSKKSTASQKPVESTTRDIEHYLKIFTRKKGYDEPDDTP